MEVHHHSHPDSYRDKRNKGTHYFWEFLMLFLAVFCGFLAEYQLEHTIEHQREKKYVLSFIEDLKSDTVNINRLSAINARKVEGIDSLTNFIWSTKITKAESKRLYDLKFGSTGSFRRVLFSKSTLTQLKNSGNLRLIKKMSIADSIVKYDLAIEFVDKYADHVTEFVNDNYKAEYEIFSDEFYGTFYSGTGYDSQDFELLTYDPKTLRMYANRLAHQGAAMNSYITLALPSIKLKAINLIQLLKKEYHLK
jgi:hypothetical protein